MNIVVKMFNKALANQMKQHIRKIIHWDDVGLIYPWDMGMAEYMQFNKCGTSH